MRFDPKYRVNINQASRSIIFKNIFRFYGRSTIAGFTFLSSPHTINAWKTRRRPWDVRFRVFAENVLIYKRHVDAVYQRSVFDI